MSTEALAWNVAETRGGQSVQEDLQRALEKCRFWSTAEMHYSVLDVPQKYQTTLKAE